MRLFLCSLFVLQLSSALASSYPQAECVQSPFQVKINRKGAFFGLLPYEFKMTKKRCVIDFDYREYYPIHWSVDICREPVHIKVEKFASASVIKKTGECNDLTSEFCVELKKMMEVIQNDGLIYAEGERDTLETTHGKLFCMYTLLGNYMVSNNYFSMTSPLEFDLFNGGKINTQIDQAINATSEGISPAAKKSEGTTPHQIPEVEKKSSGKVSF